MEFVSSWGFFQLILNNHMADNFLEKQYADYQARKAAQEQAKRKAWQKKMKEYKARIANQKAEKE